MLEQIGVALLSSLVGGILGFLGGQVVAERQARRAERHAFAIYAQAQVDRRDALLQALVNERYRAYPTIDPPDSASKRQPFSAASR